MMDRDYYQKKIISYLDGSLSAEEKSEFEAFVGTHPEFESQIKIKENELMLIKSMIPDPKISMETIESLENEMKQSISNLLKEEPKSTMDKIKNAWEDFLNR